MQLDLPRACEEELVQNIVGWLDSPGVAHMPVLAPTFRRLGQGRRLISSAAIDDLFASATFATGKEALARWTTTSSDHAAIYSAITTALAVSKNLITPAAMRTLPPDALTDLRRRFAYLEAIFHVPGVDLAAAWDPAPD